MDCEEAIRGKIKEISTQTGLHVRNFLFAMLYKLTTCLPLLDAGFEVLSYFLSPEIGGAPKITNCEEMENIFIHPLTN